MRLVELDRHCRIVSTTVSGGLGAAQGALVRFTNDWSDSSLSVSEFRVDMQLVILSKPSTPDAIKVDFVNFNSEQLVVPVLSAVWLFGSGSMILLGIVRRSDN
jgi:hypothetical protein